jgi:hypothetical protein
MPRATKRVESEYRLPEGEYFPVKLDSVEEVEIEYQRKDRKTKTPLVDEDGNPQMAMFTKWRWIFEITDGEFAGLQIFGDTPAEFSTREDNLVRIWSEVLTGKEIEIGEELDTDGLVGLEAMMSVRHDEPVRKKNGEMFYGVSPAEVLPKSDALAEEPPF